MATLRIPDKNVTLQDPFAVRQFLDLRGIVNERWSADRDLPSSATNEQVLAAYDYLLKPLMEKYGYQTMDVIGVDGQTPNLQGIREKFLDLISVPANTKHWFDLGDSPKVRAIRIFTDQAGWVPHYTNSGIDQRYRW
jgi:1,2-dihydroxy-3-keto-5-methylthiopentene dioxygenase